MVKNNFQPCFWLANGHLQTWAGALLPRAQQSTKIETLLLSDNDTLELYWLDALEPDAPILFLLHGLEGSVQSTYIQGMLALAKKNNWRAVLLHLRGSSGRVNKIPQSYHAGRTDDIIFALQHIRTRYPRATCLAIGYSLGANLLLKFLGENSKQDLVQAAVAVCAPFDLSVTTERLSRGIGKIYERTFIKSLKKTIANKMAMKMSMPVTQSELESIKTIYDFDNKITAPLHDFLNANDYYQQNSCQQFLAAIETSTLIINAEDDPIIPKEVIPRQVNASIILDIQKYGGHVGFISCNNFGRPHYWLEGRILQYLTAFIP